MVERGIDQKLEPPNSTPVGTTKNNLAFHKEQRNTATPPSPLYNSPCSSISSLNFCHFSLQFKSKLAIMERIRLFLTGLLITSLCAYPAASQNTAKGGYWPSYSGSAFPPSKINAALYTHLFYAFADLNAQTFEVTVSAENEQIAADFTSTLQKSNPSVKTLISIGGGGSDASASLAQMAADASARKKFIDSSIAVARRYGFHGLDIDWEYPDTAVNMQNFVQLLSEWKAGVEQEAQSSGKPRLLLTAAVYFYQKLHPWQVVTEYPAQSIADTLDWVNVMAYDFHGPWEKSTGAPAALYDPNSKISASSGVESWLAAGLSSQKVALGIPLYGHSWLLDNESDFGIGAPAVGQTNGDYSFTQIQDFIRDKKATEVFDKTTVSAYCYSGNVWIGYDNAESVAEKVQYAKQKNLLGYFFWSVNQDVDQVLPTKASATWG